MADDNTVPTILPELDFFALSRRLRDWIALNRTVVIGHWNDEIEYAAEAIAGLKPLPFHV